LRRPLNSQAVQCISKDLLYALFAFIRSLERVGAADDLYDPGACFGGYRMGTLWFAEE
jgi:hypothetical protein